MHENSANANLAQSVEQLIRNEQVAGSIPAIGSRQNPHRIKACGVFACKREFGSKMKDIENNLGSIMVIPNRDRPKGNLCRQRFLSISISIVIISNHFSVLIKLSISP